MKPVVATLRNFGIHLIIYLDDLRIIADSEQTARLHLATALNLLESLGFVINHKKSVLSPVQNSFSNSLPRPSPGQSQVYSQGMQRSDCKSSLQQCGN